MKASEVGRRGVLVELGSRGTPLCVKEVTWREMQGST